MPAVDLKVRSAGSVGLRKVALVAAGAWTVLVALIAAWSWQENRTSTIRLVHAEARSVAERDLHWMSVLTRAYHRGGPATEETDSVPRWLVAPGLSTPMAAFDTVGWETVRDQQFESRLVSPSAVHPAHQPDSLEDIFLRSARTALPDTMLLVSGTGARSLRYLRKVRLEQPCLACHAREGHRENDIRGLLSLTMPLAQPLDEEQQRTLTNIVGFSVLWLLGLSGGYAGTRHLRQRIRERDRAVEQRLEAEQRDRLIIEANVAGIFTTTLEGTILGCNDACARILGYASVHELMRMSVQDLYWVKEERPGMIAEVKRLGQLPGQEMMLKRKDGTAASVVVSVGMLDDHRFLGIMIDITGRKETEQALVEARERLQLETLRARIASDLHDDIGSTLSSTAIFTEMLKRQLVNPSPKMSELALRIERNLSQAQESLGEIVWTLNPEGDRLENIIARLQEYSANLLEAAGISYRNESPQGPSSAELRPDERRHLFLIVKEALNNAVRHSQCSEVFLQVEVRDGMIIISISDNGKGMPGTEGTAGNGLRNMRHRARILGGELRITSPPGGGTRVTIAAPLA